MSEEEIIEKVKTLIRFNEQDEKIRYSDFELMPNKTNYQALKGLLYLYNKEKKKNKELEKRNNECIKVGDLERAVSLLVYRNDLNNYVSKDKIKKLLEKIKQEHDVAITKMLNEDYHLAENGAVCQTLGYIEGQIEELLEGE